MLKILKYLSESKAAVAAVIVLLILQAYCELSLPQYTSEIVDVGIQQGGIEYAVPAKMRPETFENLQLLLADGDIAVFEGAYQTDSDGNYVLTKEGKKEQEELDAMLITPLVFLDFMQGSPEDRLEDLQTMQGDADAAGEVGAGSGADAAGEAGAGSEAEGSIEGVPGVDMEMAGMSIEQVREALESGMLSKEELLAGLDEAVASLGEMSGMILSQKAVTVVKEEYEALGMNLHDIQMNYLLRTGAAMLLISIVMTIAAVLVGLLAARTGAKIGRDLRGKVFSKVVSFSGSELDRFSTASLITRSTNDIQQVQMVSIMLLRLIIYSPIIGIGGVAKVANTRTGMSWIIAVAVGTIILVVGILMKVAMPKFKKMQVLVDRLNLVSREILTGVPVIRAFSRERHEEERFDGANKDLMRTQLFTNRVMNFMMPIMMLIMNGITILIVWMGAKGVDMGNLQVGDMMAFITYTMQIVMAFLMLTMISVMLPRAGVAAERIEEIVNTEPVIEDKPAAVERRKEEFQGRVSFEDVSFRYPGAEGNALEHLNFTAEPGETTAIIGSTGCGKSTLIHLIPRFYDVSEGRITVDGTDIRDLPQQTLRELLGFVPQKGVLFSGDIRSNVKFGGEGITDEQMEEAVQIAQATEFIESKPDGYGTHIAQGGTNVSGGQKQRLSIARAIAIQPKVFLFDDSFSALDYKTDVTLRKALREKTGDATVIIVAQRISTILHADQIIVLDEGKIAGIGTHEELLKTCEAYQEIAKSQLSEAELKGGQQA